MLRKQLLTLALLAPMSAHAIFDFEQDDAGNQLNHQQFGAFMLTRDGITATFTGGSAFSAGNSALYRSGVVSWMVEPVGTMRGDTENNESNGVATVTFSEDLDGFTAFIVAEDANTVVKLTTLDSNGQMIDERTTSSTTFVEVTVEQPDGAPRIAELVFQHEGGMGMGAFEDLVVMSPSSTGGGDPGGGDPGGGDPGGGDPGGMSSGGGGGSGSPGLPLIALLTIAALRRRV